MATNGAEPKSVPSEAEKTQRDTGSTENSSPSSSGNNFGSREDDAGVVSEELNIFQAILLNNFELVEQLLDTSRNDYIVHIKATDSLGRTPLYLACARGDLKVVKLILGTAAANVDPVDKHGWSPLTIAAFQGHKDVVVALLEQSADVDLRETAFSWTPLLAAVWNGHVEIVELLLSHGASPRVADKHNRTAVFLAAQRNHTSVLETILKRDGSLLNDVDNKGRTPVHVAVQMRNKDALQRLLHHRANLDKGDSDGRKALFLAHKLGYEDVAEMLIGAGANKDEMEVELGGGIGEDVRPCRGRFVANASVPQGVKVTALCEAGNKIWGGCGDGSLVIWDLHSHERLVYLPKFQGKTISNIVAVDSSTVWCLSGSNDIYIWNYCGPLNPNQSSVGAPGGGGLGSGGSSAMLSTHAGSSSSLGSASGTGGSGSSSSLSCGGPMLSGGANSSGDVAQNAAFVTNSQRLNQGTQIFPIERYGNEVYGGSSGAGIYVWNTLIPGTSRKLILDTSQLKLPEHDTYVSAMLLHSGKFYVAVKKTVAYYDISNKFAFKGAFEGHSDTITAMVVVDGKYLWTSSRDNSIKVWHLDTRECVKTFADSGGGYISCLHRTDGDQILSGGRDGRVRSWDTKELAWKRTFGTQHERDISAIFWDSNNRLWVSSLDKTVTIYE